MTYSPGDHIAVRQIWRNRIWTAEAWTVVQDGPQELVLYLSPGDEHRLIPYTPAGKPLRIPCDGFVLRNQPVDIHVLRLIAPSARHSLMLMLDQEWNPLYWYVNLEEPFRRTPIGFDYMDQLLDIVATPNLSSWQWKDEDELAEAVRIGNYTQVQADAIRAEGERVIEMIERRAPPFCDGWERWRPDPSWTTPALPDGWDVLP